MRIFAACVVILFSFFVRSGFAQELSQEVTPEVLSSRSFAETVTLVPGIVSDFQAPQSISEQGKLFIKTLEGFRPKAYKDSRGYSVGFGFQKWRGIPTTRRYPGWVTLEQADAEFDRQITLYENIVIDALDGLVVTQSEFDALVSISYNCGAVNRAILAKLQSMRRVVVADFMTTAKVRNRIHPAVYGRRLKEYVMFLGHYEEALTLPVKNWRQMKSQFHQLNSYGVSHVATSSISMREIADEAGLLAPSGVSQVGASSR